MTTTTVAPGAPASTVTMSQPARTTGRVVAYNRISRFRENVGTTSVEVSRATDRQESDANRYAAEAGYGAVDEHFTDSGRSASEYRTKARERFADLLAEVRAGRVAVILVWVLDRIVRDPRDLETLMDLCREHGVRIVQTASGSELDPTNPESILHARISGAVAAYEAAKTSMRQRRRSEAAVAAGAPHGGRRRFGYEANMERVRASEAAMIREAVRRFLAGESLRSIATWMNTPGPVGPMGPGSVGGGPTGATWTGPNLRHMIGGPHLAALRVHRGTVVGPGQWPAILSVETHQHVVHALANPDRRPSGSGNARVYLLAGLMRCHECGEPCRARPAARPNRATKGTRSAAYYCSTGQHVHRSVELVDRQVESLMVARLANLDPATGVLTDESAGAEVVRLRDARAALDDRYAEYVAEAGSMSPKAFTAVIGRLEAEMADLDAAIADAGTMAHRASRVLADASGPTAAARWYGTEDEAGWDLSRRRAIIAELASVQLRRNGARWDPEDVVITWA